MSTRRGVWVVTVVAVALLINLPIAHNWWTSYRLDREGVTTHAAVLEARALPEGSEDPQRFFVSFRLPEDADPERRAYTAEIDRATYASAAATRQVEVEYLPDHPGANRVEGLQQSDIGLWIALVADAGLLAALLLALRFGLRPDRQLVLLAGADVRRCKPDFVVEPLGRDEYLVRGDVVTIGEGEIVLDVGGGRRVRVVLGEYRNAVGYQQPAEVVGRELPAR